MRAEPGARDAWRDARAWNRLFGIYSQGPVAQTGIGGRQPPIWRMYLLPFREPRDVDTVASRAQGRGPA